MEGLSSLSAKKNPAGVRGVFFFFLVCRRKRERAPRPSSLP